METSNSFSRRAFMAVAAGSALALRAQPAKHVPVGVMAFSVHRELDQDLPGTLRSLSQMGYEGIEFWEPYFFWTPAYAKQVRALLDECHMSCFSTHTESLGFTPDGLSHAIELNKILGSQSIVAARGLVSSANPHHGFEGKGLEGWKRLAETLSIACDRLTALNMTCGFHNHAIEFEPIDGTRPIDVLAQVSDLVFHLDVGPCRQSNTDPVTFIQQYPGRIQCVLCSDWIAQNKGHQPLFSKGQEHWKEIFAAAEGNGGVHFYLMQQETSDDPAIVAIRKDLEYFHEVHG